MLQAKQKLGGVKASTFAIWQFIESSKEESLTLKLLAHFDCSIFLLDLTDRCPAQWTPWFGLANKLPAAVHAE